jgi:hypothetical protein
MDIAKNYHVILCDDVRNEVGNKLSFMGVYGPELWVGKLPAMMPKLCFVVIFEHIERSFVAAKARVIMPGYDPVELPIQALPGPQPGSNHTIIVALAPAKIGQEGRARFEFFLSDEETPQIVHEFFIRERKPAQPVVLH